MSAPRRQRILEALTVELERQAIVPAGLDAAALAAAVDAALDAMADQPIDEGVRPGELNSSNDG